MLAPAMPEPLRPLPQQPCQPRHPHRRVAGGPTWLADGRVFRQMPWLVLACSLNLPATAAETRVAVAANFAAPLAALTPGFTAATGHTLRITPGATGKFYSQILAGAPFEVLLAADADTPQRLIQQGHAVPGSALTYAIGNLVLWSPQPGLVDDQGAVLAAGRFSHLAIANPKLAPYGQAALAVLKVRGLDQLLAPKLVTGESLAQAHQFVATGNAELGFVALSQVAAPGKALVGSLWRVPQSLYPPIRQDAVLLNPGRGKPAALALLAYLQTQPAKALIQAWGYAAP